TMGSDDPSADGDERPPHQVCLSRAYCIDRTEVTNADYWRCERAGNCRAPSRDFQQLRLADFSRSEQPVVLVGGEAAKRYCSFAGKRLPTEAEWEHAAGGPGGSLFPWGNDEPTCETAVVGAYALECLGQVPWCRLARQCLGQNPSHPMAAGSR